MKRTDVSKYAQRLLMWTRIMAHFHFWSHIQPNTSISWEFRCSISRVFVHSECILPLATVMFALNSMLSPPSKCQ